ncbi:MAG TPA: hypothetical protein VEX68_21235 [Bryobacteraceae bacterium]|nr:hypothetical protein [Bryobacteraceae bacterium]
MLQSRRVQLDLDSRIINAWLDARIDTDYLESRALKFVIVVEMLRAIVLRSQPPRRHLDQALWEQFLLYALPHLKFYLQAGIRCTNDVVQALTNRRKWEDLNRRSFRSDISAALKLLGAKESGRTIELFVESRNKLIHEGRFRCTSEPLPLESDAPRTATDEYLFVAGFVDRVILQSFGLHDVLTY